MCGREKKVHHRQKYEEVSCCEKPVFARRVIGVGSVAQTMFLLRLSMSTI